MDPVLVVLAFGLVGGFVMAASAGRHRKGGHTESVVVTGRDLMAAPVINMASIKVEGLGGLGLVIVCAGVAIAIPSIGRSMVLGAVLGVAFAAVLIARRRSRPLPSSGARPGANTTLSIDAPVDGGPTPNVQRPGFRVQGSSNLPCPPTSSVLAN